MLDSQLRNLNLRHIQADEIWTFCQKKQGKLSDTEKLNPELGDQYLFVALDFSKKLDNLRAAISLHVAHYNFCRIHGTLGTTPAVAAGVTAEPWPLERLLAVM